MKVTRSQFALIGTASITGGAARKEILVSYLGLLVGAVVALWAIAAVAQLGFADYGDGRRWRLFIAVPLGLVAGLYLGRWIPGSNPSRK